MALSSYHVTYLITEDSGMRVRVAACAQAEALSGSKNLGMEPEEWAHENRWRWASTPGWNGKAQTALENGVDTWGLDPSVITDGDILSAIQPMITALP